MYRVLQGHNGKVADATYVAGAKMKKGMLVVKSTDGKVNFPSAATDKNVFFVGKELIATGIDGDRDLPDYNDVFENISEGEFVTSEKPVAGEVYFTDQTKGTFTQGGYATVGTEGLLVSSTEATKIQIVKTDAVDCGTHAGVEIAILD